jgi:heparan-sulfate lyase
MIYKLFFLLLAAFLLAPLKSQTLDKEVFDLLNLNYKGLEKVKKLHETGKDAEASLALLKYYKARTTVKNPDVNWDTVRIGSDVSSGDD